MLLLASRGLFICLIAVIAVVVLLCLAFSGFLYYKALKVKKTLEADVIRKELHRRETELVIRLVKEKPDESKREALINELRRVKSAELLVEEIVKNERAERGIADPHAPKKPEGAPAGEHHAPHAPKKPEGAPAGAKAPAEAPKKPEGAPEGKEKPAEKPAEPSKPAEK